MGAYVLEKEKFRAVTGRTVLVYYGRVVCDDVRASTYFRFCPYLGIFHPAFGGSLALFGS